MTSETKQCTKCGEEKPATLEYFHKYGNGLYPQCKVCKNKEKQIWKKQNPDKVREQKKRWKKRNPDKVREGKRKWYRTPAGKLAKIRHKATERGIYFDLQLEHYKSNLWGKPCHYCGCEIKITGLDRKDSNKGYTPDNVVPCCHSCNSMKSDKPYKEFIVEVKNER